MSPEQREEHSQRGQHEQAGKDSRNDWCIVAIPTAAPKPDQMSAIALTRLPRLWRGGKQAAW
jgi:hypothetical protein